MECNCFLSSFNHEALKYFETKQIEVYSTNLIETIYLYNFCDKEEMPSSEIYTSQGSGINLSSRKVTHEIVQNCHRAGKKVGIWIDKKYDEENEDLYGRFLRMGVDFICTDYP